MELKPRYKQTEVGVIPEDWEVRTVGTIADVIDPQPDHRTPPEIGLGEPYIGISDFIGDSQVDWDNSRKIISKAVDKQQASFKIDPGDIIFGKIGTIGLPKFVPVTHFRYALSANVLLIKPRVPPYFLMSWLNSNAAYKNIKQELHSTSQSAFGIKKMRNLLLPLPPTLAEQRAIAEALSDADVLIESLEQLIAKKRAIKQGTTQELLTGRRRLPGFSGEWEETALGQVGKCYRGVSYNPSTDLLPFDTKSSIRLLRSNNVQEARLVFSDMQYVNSSRVSSDQRLQVNDILVCMANGSRDLVGKAGKFSSNDGFEYTFGAFMGCFRAYREGADSDFVFYLFQTEKYRNHISILLAGSSINNLTPTNVEALAIRIPFKKAEQIAIAAVLGDIDAEIAALETKLGKVRLVKQGMMQELLTGKTRLV